MAGSVKSRRPYRSPKRELQRAETRAAIIRAAAGCFIDEGYVATPITRIAELAGVSPETVYAIFGTKRDVLRAVMEHAAAGAPDGEVLRLEWIAQIRREPDQHRRLALMAGATRDVLRHVAPFDEMVRSVAATDPEIAQLRDDFERRRRSDVRMLIGLLEEVGPLRMPTEDAVDLMWALSRSTDLYAALTVDRRWSDRRARAALLDVLQRALLDDG
jgi:AcrR family transcriptional regulator